MSCTIAGDFIFTFPEPEAVFDQQNNCYRYYYKFLTFIPTDNLRRRVNAQLTMISDAEATVGPLRQFICCEAWVPVRLPDVPYKHMSLVHLRGRIILPPDNTRFEQDKSFVIFIEVISSHVRQELTSSVWTPGLLKMCARPEPTIIGKIKQISEGSEGWVTLLIETTNKVSGRTERASVG